MNVLYLFYYSFTSKTKIMIKLSNKDALIYSDENYHHAINYTQSLYNFPITLNVGAKHNRAKFILSAGTLDNIEIYQDGIFYYVIAQNNGLSYVGLNLFNIETKESEGSVFLNEEDSTHPENFSFGVLDMDSEDQIKILCEYL